MTGLVKTPRIYTKGEPPCVLGAGDPLEVTNSPTCSRLIETASVWCSGISRPAACAWGTAAREGRAAVLGDSSLRSRGWRGGLTRRVPLNRKRACPPGWSRRAPENGGTHSQASHRPALRRVGPAGPPLLDEPLRRPTAGRAIGTPVDRRLDPDGADGHFIGGRVATADRAADAPPRADQRRVWCARWLKENRPGRRPVFGRSSAGLAPAQQTDDLGLEEPPPHGRRRRR
jgi:hypothetical protein